MISRPFGINKMANAADKIWRQFEMLLEEAVMKSNNAGVEMLLDFENGALLGSIPRLQPKSSIPLILAINEATEQQDVSIVSIFRRYQYILPEPHEVSCGCNNCTGDKLSQTKLRILTLRALSSPIWLSLTSDDPFTSLFQLCKWTRNFSKENISFGVEYDAVSKQAVDLCLNLLDEIRTTSEGEVIMRHKHIKPYQQEGQDDGHGDLTFIVHAIDYKQKEVVAHPVVQHFLSSEVFDEIPYWRTSGIVYKFSLVVLVALLFPITSCLNIFCPTMKCVNSLGNIAMKPFVKFVNGAASFILFLVILAWFGSEEQISGIRGGRWPPTVVEVVVFVWLLGFCFGEIRQVYKNGIRNYFNSGWNWVDVGMDSLMLLSYIAWIVLTFDEKDRHTEAYKTVLQVADGAFTVAIILSFFRVIYLCQITSYLGLLQLCFSQMIMVIAQFTFICVVVLFAFSVGMVFLFHASETGKDHIHGMHSHHDNQTAIFEVLSENFAGFWSTLFTMIYVSLSMQGTETLKDFSDGSLIHLWSNLLFICYYGITMIVVLNMLIAMMNSSYQMIADNLAMEHLYSQSKLWLEYVGDEQERPVPLNLIPSLRMMQSWCRALSNSACCRKEDNVHAKLEEEERRLYKEVCDTLMERYMRKEFGFYTHDELEEKDYEESDRQRETDPFLEKLETYFLSWERMITSGLYTSHVFDFIENNAYSDEEEPKQRRYSRWIIA